MKYFNLEKIMSPNVWVHFSKAEHYLNFVLWLEGKQDFYGNEINPYDFHWSKVKNILSGHLCYNMSEDTYRMRGDINAEKETILTYEDILFKYQVGDLVKLKATKYNIENGLVGEISDIREEYVSLGFGRSVHISEIICKVDNREMDQHIFTDKPYLEILDLKGNSYKFNKPSKFKVDLFKIIGNEIHGVFYNTETEGWSPIKWDHNGDVIGNSYKFYKLDPYPQYWYSGKQSLPALLKTKDGLRIETEENFNVHNTECNDFICTLNEENLNKIKDLFESIITKS